ncbi:MAG: sulfur oxidation c-type cytochrome SoxA [Hyphomicrobiales bacterium]
MKSWILVAAIGAFAAVVSTGLALGADGMKEAVKPEKDNPLPELWSGYHFATKDTQAMQDDDFQNPAMPWYETGASLWKKVDGGAGKSCASCHQDAAASMKTAATTYPVYDEKLKTLVNIENRINNCREQNMKAAAWKYDSDELLGMTIYIKRQAEGQPIHVKIDGPAKEWFDKGKEFYYARRGQMDLSCAHCHEKYYGQQIRMNILTQGQSNGFPTYRLVWQKPGSLHRRFKGCNDQVRAAAYKVGGEEYLALELYLAWRGNGLTVEAPSVRN